MKFIKKKKKLFVVIAAVLAFVLFFTLKPKKSAIPFVTTTPIKQTDLSKEVSVSGKIEANDSAEVSSPYNFKVTHIFVKEGDTVTAGQVLAKLDSQELNDEILLLQQEIATDQARLNESYDKLNYINQSTESFALALDDARTKYDQAVSNEQRQKELYEAGAVSLVDYENAQNETLSADIALKQAQESLDKAKIDIESQINATTPQDSDKMALETKRTMLAQKQKKLADLSIKSPINGTITRVYSKVGRLAQDSESNKSMFVIEDSSAKYLSAKVSEYDISNIVDGQEARITSDVLEGESVQGTVDRVSPTAEPKDNGNEMVVPVKILVTQNDDRLITGVTAKANIVIKSVKNVLNVPYESVGNEGDKKYIYTLQDGKLKKVYVTTGLESDFDVEVSSSEIKKDMPVVTSVQDNLADGMVVQAADEQSADMQSQI